VRERNDGCGDDNSRHHGAQDLSEVSCGLPRLRRGPLQALPLGAPMASSSRLISKLRLISSRLAPLDGARAVLG